MLNVNGNEIALTALICVAALSIAALALGVTRIVVQPGAAVCLRECAPEPLAAVHVKGNTTTCVCGRGAP